MELTLIDFIIGLTLMNAMPHFVLGTFRARMLSGFGYGHRANIAYGLLNFSISLALYILHIHPGRPARRGHLSGSVGRFADILCDRQVLL